MGDSDGSDGRKWMEFECQDIDQKGNKEVLTAIDIMDIGHLKKTDTKNFSDRGRIKQGGWLFGRF